MASISSPVVPPTPVTSGLADQPIPSRGRVPSESSTSPLASAQRASYIPQLASARYIRQFRALLDRQRELFDQERALWHLERSDLEDHISRLEETLRKAQLNPSSHAMAPTDTSISGSGSFGLSTASSSRPASTGNEFWRGTIGRSQHLPSISENVPPRDTGNLSLTNPMTSIPKPKIPEGNSSTFDGINFRQNSRAPSVATGGIAQESSSASDVSLGTLSLPSFPLGPPSEFITKHAGHTPLAREPIQNTDGTSSLVPSTTATPTEPEKERPPHEPHASFARPPSERSESYFAGAVADAAEDPAIAEPLTLSENNSPEDESFLDRVGSRLEEAVRHKQRVSNAPVQETSDQSDIISDPPESEPKLKFKRSMNFGSQLGGSKGF